MQNFYERKPIGLKGALEDLGIKFEGREHSGLSQTLLANKLINNVLGIDDACNTAKLCARLVSDGCQLKITKVINQPKVMLQASLKLH